MKFLASIEPLTLVRHYDQHNLLISKDGKTANGAYAVLCCLRCPGRVHSVHGNNNVASQLNSELTTQLMDISSILELHTTGLHSTGNKESIMHHVSSWDERVGYLDARVVSFEEKNSFPGKFTRRFCENC